MGLQTDITTTQVLPPTTSFKPQPIQQTQLQLVSASENTNNEEQSDHENKMEEEFETNT